MGWSWGRAGEGVGGGEECVQAVPVRDRVPCCD